MSDKVFAKGIYVKPPKENSPDFVKFSMSIKRNEAMGWLQSQSDEWVNLQVKEAKSGKWYCEVDTWKPNPNRVKSAQPDSFSDLAEAIPF